MGGNTISRGNVSIFFQEQDICSAVLQPFCGNSAEHIFCLRDRICSQDRFPHLIVFTRLKAVLQKFCSTIVFAGQQNRVSDRRTEICLQDRFGCLIILPLRAENIERCTGLFCILRSAKIACAECLTLSSARFSLSKFFSVLLSLLFCKNSFHSAQNTLQDI